MLEHNRIVSLTLMTASLSVGAVLWNAPAAHAESAPIDLKAYADRVVFYERGESENWGQSRFNNPETALGKANWTADMVAGGSLGAWKGDIGVSLGRQGVLTLEFTDNYLTGSGDSASDLWIFEIGKNPEDTLVEISTDGENWYNAGLADRQDYTFDTGIGLDIDTLLNTDASLNLDSQFSFVRLTDAGTNGYGGSKSGTDIDAIAALSYSVKDDPVAVPEPSLSIALGLMGASFLLRRQRLR